MNRALHAFAVGGIPAVRVRIYPDHRSMCAGVRKLIGWCKRSPAGVCVHRRGERDPISTIFLNARQLTLVTIVHEVQHAMQDHSLFSPPDLDADHDREYQAHWVSECVEDIVARLLLLGYVWSPKRGRGMLFNVGFNLQLAKPSVQAIRKIPA